MTHPRPRQERKLVSRSHKVSRQASRRICNPALKNVLTYWCSADLQSAASEIAFPFIFVGGLQIPRFDRSNLFLRRISNPPGRLAGDFMVMPGGFETIIIGFEQSSYRFACVRICVCMRTRVHSHAYAPARLCACTHMQCVYVYYKE